MQGKDIERALARALVVCSAIGACSPPGDEPPDAPEMLEVALVDGGAQLTWVDGSDNEDEFVILRSAPAQRFEEIAALDADVEAYHDPDLGTGKWIYKVVASNDAGESPSDEATLTIP